MDVSVAFDEPSGCAPRIDRTKGRFESVADLAAAALGLCPYVPTMDQGSLQLVSLYIWLYSRARVGLSLSNPPLS